jgi:hypothetical protein
MEKRSVKRQPKTQNCLFIGSTLKYGNSAVDRRSDRGVGEWIFARELYITVFSKRTMDLYAKNGTCANPVHVQVFLCEHTFRISRTVTVSTPDVARLLSLPHGHEPLDNGIDKRVRAKLAFQGGGDLVKISDLLGV